VTRANACDAASSALQLRLDFSTPPAKQQSRRSASPLVTPCPAIPARYFTRAEAAAYIRCSLRFLDGMSLPFIRKGRCKVYDRIDLDAYMQDDRHRGRAYGLVLPDGRRVCQSTGCINRTDAEAHAVRLKNEALEARQQGLLGIFVWQQAVVRYLEELADKRSLSDDKDHLKKLDPYLRSLKLEAIDMTVLQPFIRDRKLKDGGIERDSESRPRGSSADLEYRAPGLAMAPWGAEDSDAEGTAAACALLETRGGGSIDRGIAGPHETDRRVCARDGVSCGRDPGGSNGAAWIWTGKWPGSITARRSRATGAAFR